MKKIIIAFALIIASLSNIYSQSEYRYFVFRIGANHNFLSSQPKTSLNRYLDVEGIGNLKLVPAMEATNSRYIDYNFNVVADIYLHYDLTGDRMGLVLGGEYATNSITAKYISTDGKYWVEETFKAQSIGIPFFIKMGKDIYDAQRYFFVGGQYNINFDLTEKQTNWADKTYTLTKQGQKLRKGTITAFIGFNFLIFNLQLDYTPHFFLNADYTDADGLKPYKDYTGGYFSFKTSLNIPISEWTTTNNWYYQKLRRKLKRLF